MGKWIKFRELSKNDKIFRVINLLIMLAQFVACLIFGFYYIAVGRDDRLFASFGIGILVLAPLLIEYIFRHRFSNVVFLCTEFYILLAGFMGCVLDLYNLTNWFDIVVHILAGYVFALLGIFVIARLNKYSSLNIWTVIVFCFCFTMACELIWELLEWFADNCLGQTSQGDFVEGYNAPLVTDTMIDILCNFGGGIVFCLHYLLGKYCPHSLGIRFFEKELAKGETIERPYNKNVLLLDASKNEKKTQADVDNSINEKIDTNENIEEDNENIDNTEEKQKNNTKNQEKDKK